jgi:hypothetical protein
MTMGDNPMENKLKNLPGLDVFVTPENAAFCKSNPYDELDKEKKEIRLLRLETHTCDPIIRCELLPSQPVAEVRDKYTALSYCAGDANMTETIVVNGNEFNVFANLHHALHEVRHFYSYARERCLRDCLLWVDQVCINQFNIVERSHQVGFMRDIYESAQTVLVCLSTPR